MSTTEAPPPPSAGQGPRVSAEDARDLTRLRRTVSTSPQGRHVAGVAGGLARHLDVDPVVVRVALVVLVFFGGAGLLLYVAGWLLVPEEGATHAVIRLDDRTRAVVLWVIAALAALAVVGESLGRFNVPWPLVLIGLVVLWLVTRKRRDTVAPSPWATYPTPDATDGPGTGAAPMSAMAPSAAPVPASPMAATTHPVDAPVEPGEPGNTTALGSGAWIPPDVPVSGRRPDPRKSGPVLFWFALALIALAEGVLGIVDVAGADIPGAAYPALALGLIGALLVAGAFVGRAGGLIALGLVATLALVGMGIGDHLGPRRTLEVTPSTAAAVAPGYHIGAGRIRLDLTQVDDLSALDGRQIDLSANLGQIEVVVPSGVGVHLQAQVHGPGDVRAFGVDHGGMGVTFDQVYAGRPMITVVADLKVGQIEVREPAGGVR